MEVENITYESLWRINGGLASKWKSFGQWIPLSEDFLAFSGRIKLDSAVFKLKNSAEEIVKEVLTSSGSWNIVHWKSALKTMFIGRDIFGRESLVWSSDGESTYISCSVPKNYEKYGELISLEWNEVPYAQITEIVVDKQTGIIHSYFESYPNDEDTKWKDTLNLGSMYHKTLKVGLYQVNKEVEYNGENDVVTILCEMLGAAIQDMLPTDQAVVGICFSGGVDSVLLSHVLLNVLPVNVTVKMINVAFGETDEKCSEAPDRKRALQAFDHLKSCAKGKNIDLILTNVNRDELDECRRKFIAQAALPCMSVLDDSLACVVWFALRGRGISLETGLLEQCKSSYMCMGSGADEVFAGYARHRNRYNVDGHASVAEECTAELRRLGSRNGGRDARVACQLSKKLICPFLDDSFVAWANALPILAKCNLSLPRGVGEKRIIRQALERLGAAHQEPKQAMQFGSRMAKMTNESKLVKGSHLSNHLLDSRN